MGKKNKNKYSKHNYVNIPSTSVMDKITESVFLNQQTKDDLIKLHRTRKDIAMVVIDAINLIDSTRDIDSVFNNKPLTRIEVVTLDGDMLENSSKVYEFCDNDEKHYETVNDDVVSGVLVKSFIETEDCELKIFKYASLTLSKGSTIIPHTISFDFEIL